MGKLTSKKTKIKNVPLSKQTSKGSKASLGDINYNYQKYYNTFAFLKEILKRDNKLNKLVCIPNVGSDWYRSFIKLQFLDETIPGKLKSVKPVDPLVSRDKFNKEIKKCMNKRFVPLSLQIIIPKVGTHANIIIFDTKLKTVELFEPHGARDNMSELESVTRGYYKVARKIYKYIRINFPQYKYIPPNKYEPNQGLQARIDAFSGLCVSWSILYLHYRILNPDVNPKILIDHINSYMTRNKLLRYTRYVEDILKDKV